MADAQNIFTTIYPKGPLLVRTHIVDVDNNDLTAADVDSVTLSVYKQVMSVGGQMTREVLTDWDAVELTVSEVVFPTITAANGKKRNFSHCVEGAFTLSNQTYIVEYIITLADGHTRPIVIQATTTN